MANKSNANLGKSQEAFEDQQRTGLDSLFSSAAPDKVDLAAAESVGVLAKGMKSKIDAALPGHEQLFAQAYNPNGVEYINDKVKMEAFKRAFEIVYGRFLYDQHEVDQANMDPTLKTGLDGALKFSIEENGLKGRPELIAAMRHVSMAKARGVNTDTVVKTAFAVSSDPARLKELERVHNTANTRSRKLKASYDFFTESDSVDAFLGAHSSFSKMVEGASFVAGKTFKEQRLDAKSKLELTRAELAGLKRPSEGTITSQIETARRTVGAANFNDAAETAERAKITGRYDTERTRLAGELRGAEKELETCDNVMAQAQALQAELKKVLDNMAKAQDFGIVFGFLTAGDIEKFKGFELKSDEFSPEAFKDFSVTISGFFNVPANVQKLSQDFDAQLAKSEDDVSSAKSALDKANAESKGMKNLSDTAAAKKIISGLLLTQFPDMSATDLDKLATMVLSQDLAKIQNADTYDEIARKGSARALDIATQAGFKAKLIEFKYMTGEKTVQPFKGLKPEDFSDWPKIERLFKIGKIDHENGFFVLAAFEKFVAGVPSIQSVQIEKKLKGLLAKKLGVSERMDEAGVVQIVNEAFDEQLDNVRPLVEAYFDHYDANRESWDARKVEELNVKGQMLAEEYKLGKIDQAQYDKRLAELTEEAKEFGLIDKVNFVESSLLADYFNSPDSEWLRSIGHGVKEWAKGKSIGIGKSAASLTGFAALGAAKLAGSLAYQTAMAPFRLLKYPWMMTLGPVVNLFRTKPWTPLADIKNAVVSDASRAAGYVAEKATGTVGGAAEKLKTVPVNKWKETEFKRVEYKDRAKLKLDDLEAKAKEFKEKGESTPVGIEGSPFINLDDYKGKIAKLDKIISDAKAA